MSNEPEIEIIPRPQSETDMVLSAQIDKQVATAKQYPRDVKKSLEEAKSLATLNQDIAEDCSYTLSRDGKNIDGPSIRLAEIMATSWGNLQFAGRIVLDNGREIVAEGACWDLQRNVRASKQVSRRVTKKDGRRYSPDMVAVTANAAMSIAIRNAILTVVPRVFADQVYQAAREVALGKTKSLEIRRSEVFERLSARWGLSDERICAAVGKTNALEVGWPEIEQLLGIGAAVKDGVQSLEEAFPVPAAPDDKPTQTEADRKKSKSERAADMIGETEAETPK